MGNSPIFIAEVKTKSPFGYQSHRSWEELFEIANEIGDIISVHTDERWGGSLKILEKAIKMTKKPILAKGIHEKDEEIQAFLDIGASYVLVVGRIPGQFSPKSLLIEPLSMRELESIPHEYKVVWNSRDLHTGTQKTENFSEARSLFPGWLCQASNIRTENDIHPMADAILVGEHLLNFKNMKSFNNINLHK